MFRQGTEGPSIFFVDFLRLFKHLDPSLPSPHSGSAPTGSGLVHEASDPGGPGSSWPATDTPRPRGNTRAHHARPALRPGTHRRPASHRPPAPPATAAPRPGPARTGPDVRRTGIGGNPPFDPAGPGEHPPVDPPRRQRVPRCSTDTDTAPGAPAPPGPAHRPAPRAPGTPRRRRNRPRARPRPRGRTYGWATGASWSEGSVPDASQSPPDGRRLPDRTKRRSASTHRPFTGQGE